MSAEAFLRRLSTLGIVPVEVYRQRRAEFIAAHEDEAERARSAGGGNWYRNTVRDLGKGYVRAVTDAHRRRVIDSNTAAIYLDAKVSQIRSWLSQPNCGAWSNRCALFLRYQRHPERTA